MVDEERYIGLVTRSVAFAIDAAAINLVALVVSVGAALILSLFRVGNLAHDVLVVVGAVAYLLWTIGYFVGFWSATGETPGDRALRIRVVPIEGGRLRPRRAVLRCLGLVVSAIPLFAGYLMIPFERRRRALHDLIARTVVVESPTLSLAEVRRRRRRVERDLRSSDSGDEQAVSAAQA